MIDFISLRGTLESSAPVLAKFAAVGEFSITAGEFLEKVAPALGLQKEAAALVKACGSDPELFRFRSRDNGSSLVPYCVIPSIFTNGEGALSCFPDLSPMLGEILSHNLGMGGYAVMKVGTTSVKVRLNLSDEFRNALVNCREDSTGTDNYLESQGAPPTEIASPYDGETITTLKLVPQRDLPPWAAEVPRMVDLEVVAVLESSRQYKSPRITVKVENGSTIVGLICTQPIVRALTGVEKGAVELTEAVIGQRFQILDVQDRMKRVKGEGEALETVKNQDGTVQKQVLVRNTTQKLEFTL